jgi:ABC transport system ATP-binding/permease protein
MLSVLSQRPNFLVMDEPSVDCDLDTIQALETYLQQEFDGVLVVVSHDRAFADKIADHLFVFEGEGEIKDFGGTLSEYARTLIEIENDDVIAGGVKSLEIVSGVRKASYKEDRAKRNEQQNVVRRAKKYMDNLEVSIEKLKEKSAAIEAEILVSSEKGWSVLAELTEGNAMDGASRGG